MMNISIILNELARGRELASDELLFLMETVSHGREIMELAHSLNRDINGDTVTFVHNRNINYTNICQNSCLFCAFRRSNTDVDSYVLSPEEILERIASTPGITEVCIQGGILPGLNFSYILEILQAIVAIYPDIHIHAFSPMELKSFANISGYSIDTVISKLMESGLGSIPGTAAEILDGQVREVICPEKVSALEWVDIITKAHRLGIRSTATILLGHIETNLQIVRHMEILRGIQKKTGGFTEFIPLIFVPHGTALGKKFGVSNQLSFTKMLKFYALSRIYFNRLIPNIQSSWPKLGLENAVMCLSAGVNDLGGTLYEENITRNAGGNHGQKVAIDEFRQHIIEAGKTPRQRDTLYHILPDFVPTLR
jgi:FO synthase subunit 2